MAKPLSCPNCGTPLTSDGEELTVRCLHCNAAVIIPGALRNAQPPAEAPSPSAPQVRSGPWVGSALLSPGDRLREIGQHMRNNKKAKAVHLFRDTFNVNAADAQKAVEALMAGKPVLLPGAAMIGSATVEAASNPSITTRFTPQASATSSRGSTYTLNSGPNVATPFIRDWVRLSLVWIMVAVMLMLLGLVFPNTSRLAAPLWCPSNYIDAYGNVSSVSVTSTNPISFLVLNCADAEGQVTQPNGLVVGLTLFGIYMAAGVVLAFGFAALFRFKLAGILPFVIVLALVLAALLAYATLIPSPVGNPLLRLFDFG